jgi:hypothetical protein
MTTANDKQELKQQLLRDGKLDFFYNPPPRAQYYRPDGTPLPSLLPSDAYGMKRYLAKGFTLSPSTDASPSTEPAYPDTVVPYQPGKTKVELVDSIATIKQERKQALHEEASEGFEGEPEGFVTTVADLTIFPPSITEEEERTIYEKWRLHYEAETKALAGRQPEHIPASVNNRPHLHRFASNQIGSTCRVQGCAWTRQRKSKSRRSR